MKSRPSQPSPVVVNPAASASQQATYNVEAARQQRALNMINQYSPGGSIEYAPTGRDIEGIPQFGITQTLSPQQRELYDLSNAAARTFGKIGTTQLEAVRSTLEQPFDVSGLGAAPIANEQTRLATRANIISRAQPQFAAQEDALKTSLANQGITVGSRAYEDAIAGFDRSRNDFLLAADAQAGNEMARTFGLEASARDRAINELAQARNIPLNELSALMSGAAPEGPQFLSTPQGQIAAPDLMGAQYASANQANVAAQNVFNQRSTAYGQGLGGLYNLGAAGFEQAGWRWSDRRLKTDITRVGETPAGHAIYRFRYIGGNVWQTGFMADEIKRDLPDMVMRIGNYDAVNYAGVRTNGS